MKTGLSSVDVRYLAVELDKLLDGARFIRMSFLRLVVINGAWTMRL